MPNNQFFWYTRIFKTENIISQNYALKLAHLFYLLINYNLYVITTSQDCETFFYTTLVTEYHSGIFLWKVPMQTRQNWQPLLLTFNLFLLSCIVICRLESNRIDHSLGSTASKFNNSTTIIWRKFYIFFNLYYITCSSARKY